MGLTWLRGSGAIVHLSMDTSNRLILNNDVTGTSLTGPVVSLNVWHSLEIHTIINGTSSTVEVWLDGAHVTALETTTANLGTTPITQVQLGEGSTARTYDMVFDDAVVQATRIGQ